MIAGQVFKTYLVFITEEVVLINIKFKTRKKKHNLNG